MIKRHLLEPTATTAAAAMAATAAAAAAAAAACSGGVGGCRTSVESYLETMPMRSKGGSVPGKNS